MPIFIDRIFFFLSPFLSLPFVLRGVFYQNKVSFILFCLILSFISFSYIPSFSQDKAYYIYLFQIYKDMPFFDFLNYFLQLKTDFFFYGLLYFLVWLGLPFETFSLLVTFVTCYLIIIVFYKQNLKFYNNNKEAFLYFIIVVFSISLPGLLSGMRYYLAVAFAFYSIHLLLNEGRQGKACIFIFLAVITHFSFILYAAVVLIYKLLNNKAVKLLFFISLGFLFIPKSFLLGFFSYLPLSDIYNSKVNSYLGEGGFVENSINVGNFNNSIRIFLTGLWFYIALIFSFLNIRNRGRCFVFFLCLMSSLNIVYSAPDLLLRYGYLGNIVFLLILFFEENLKFRRVFVYSILLVNFLSFSANFMVVRPSLVFSLSKIETLTLPTIFLTNTTKI